MPLEGSTVWFIRWIHPSRRYQVCADVALPFTVRIRFQTTAWNRVSCRRKCPTHRCSLWVDCGTMLVGNFYDNAKAYLYNDDKEIIVGMSWNMSWCFEIIFFRATNMGPLLARIVRQLRHSTTLLDSTTLQGCLQSTRDRGAEEATRRAAWQNKSNFLVPCHPCHGYLWDQVELVE